MAARTRPVALTIAGSDCCAGAGLQADLKTFGSLGCHGLTVATCVVSETPGRVAAIQPVRPALVRSQITLLRAAYPIQAAKTGMLYSERIVRETAESLEGARFPLVVDPVMVATSGDPLLKKSAIRAYFQRLFPLATLLTPNVDELALLSGRAIRTRGDLRAAGRELFERCGCAILLKGGHLGGREAVDFLIGDGLDETYSAPFLRGIATHGTGCTYSAAIAAGLAQGLSLPESVQNAKSFITRAIAGYLRWGKIHALDQISPAATPARARRGHAHADGEPAPHRRCHC